MHEHALILSAADSSIDWATYRAAAEIEEIEDLIGYRGGCDVWCTVAPTAANVTRLRALAAHLARHLPRQGDGRGPAGAP